tara:strand:- start:1578 stop:2285 length:708 start_codon:yes stop_codon:yes gene_type:complete
MTYTTQSILDNISSGASTAADHLVFLNFKSRNDVDSSAPWITNRIALKVETLNISTTRTVPAFPLPFSGAITGESSTFAIDMGMATKNIQITGIITEQTIIKADEEDNLYTVQMTAYEVAQLIHSSVDSSFIQNQQSIGELVILMPSRVGNDYAYHAGVDQNTTLETCPLIPWTWASRTLDQANTIGASDFPSPVTGSNTVNGVNGFIQNFGTDIQGGQPFIGFNMGFEVAGGVL